MRTIVSLIVGVFAVLAMAIPVEAQNSWDAECNSLDAQARQAPRHLQRQMYEMARQCWSARYDQYNRQRAFEKDRMRGFDPYYGQQSSLYGVGGVYNPYGWQMQNFGGGYGSMLRYPYDPYQGYYGRIVQNAGNPYFDALVVPCQIAEKNQRWQKAIGATVLGTVVGAAIGGAYGHAGKGALAGAGGGAGIALLNNSRYCSPPQQIHLPVQQQTGQPNQQDGEASVPSSDRYQAPKPVAGPAVSSGGGEFVLSNSSPFRGEVYYNDKYLGRLNPGTSMKVDYPEGEGRYSAHLLVPNEEGGISSLPAKIVPESNGFRFADPTSAGR